MENIINKERYIPGPWSTEVLGDTLRIIDSEGNYLILVGHCRSEVKQANGKLMAMAPELLEMLIILQKRLVELILLTETGELRNLYVDQNIWALKVIKKATI